VNNEQNAPRCNLFGSFSPTDDLKLRCVLMLPFPILNDDLKLCPVLMFPSPFAYNAIFVKVIVRGAFHISWRVLWGTLLGKTIDYRPLTMLSSSRLSSMADFESIVGQIDDSAPQSNLPGGGGNTGHSK